MLVLFFMKVSVIVPCFNVAKLIQPLLESLLEQDYKDFEVIFVNDGSTDDTSSVLRAFMSEATHGLKGKCKLIEKVSGGPGSARNAGLDVAKGELVCFVDGDDYIFPQTLGKLAELMIENVDLAIGSFKDHSGTITSFADASNIDEWLRCFIPRGALTLWNKMYRMRIINDNRIRFDETVMKSEDHLFTARYLMSMQGRIAVTPYVVYFYNWNPMSISHVSMTTHRFNPWISDSVFVAVRIYRMMAPCLSKETRTVLRYDAYHKYRRIRHEGHQHRCKEKKFYRDMYLAMRSIMPSWEMVLFAVQRRASIIAQSLKKKIRKIR